jgi:hypothetical protein
VVAAVGRVNGMPIPDPLTRRAFRHPGTGHAVARVVGRGSVVGGPRELLWQVWLEDAPGRPPEVAALRFMCNRCLRATLRRG